MNADCRTGGSSRSSIRGSRATAACVLAALWVGLLAAELRAGDTVVLQLQGGDFVRGSPTQPPPDCAIGWDSERFAEPLGFEWRGVARILFPLFVGANLPARARVTTRSGDMLYGDVETFDGTVLVLKSPRHGTLTLSVQSLRRLDVLDSAELWMDGIRDASQWRTPEGSASPYFALDNASFVGTGGEGNWVCQELREGKPFEVDLALEASGSPRFRMVLAAPQGLSELHCGFSFEIMSVGLVVHRQVDGELEYARASLPADRTTLEFRVQVDPTQGTVRVLSEGEEVLAFTDARALSSCGRFMYLESRSPRLVFDRLRVTEAGSSPSLPALLRGEDLVSIDSSGVVVVAGDAGPLALDSLESILFGDVDAADPPAQEGPPLRVRTHYFDGATVAGRPVQVDESGLDIEMPGASGTVRLPFEGMQRLTLDPPPDTPRIEGAEALLEAEGVHLLGRIVGGEGPEALRFRPAYSARSVPLVLGEDLTIRFLDSPPGGETALALGDELHLRNGDVVPCRILEGDERILRVLMAGGVERVVDRNEVKACVLQANGVHAKDETRLQWRGKCDEKGPDGVHLVSGDLASTTIRSEARCRIAFDVEFEGESGMLQFGVAEGGGAQPNFSRHLAISLQYANRRLMATAVEMNPPSGMMIWGNQGPGPSTSNRNLGESRRIHAEIRLDTESGQYQLWVDGQVLLEGTLERTPHLRVKQVFFAVGDSKALGRNGLVFLNVNGFKVNGGQKEPAVQPVRVRGLRVHDWSGHLPHEKLARVTTRRRGEAGDSLRDVLRARNGDLLRGRVLALDEEHFVFRSRLDTLTLPRERISEWIDLGETDRVSSSAQSSDPEDRDAVCIELVGGRTLSITPSSSDETMMLGHSSVLGDCSVYWRDVVALRTAGGDRKASEYAEWVLREPTALPDENCAPGEASASTPAPSPATALQGRAAKPFELRSLAGDSVRLQDAAGKVVVLHFFATWNRPSADSLPLLAAALDEFDPEQCTWWCIDQGEDSATLRRFLAARSLTLPVLIDSEGVVSREYKATVLPQTVVIGPDGKIRKVFLGIAEVGDAVAEAVRAALPR